MQRTVTKIYFGVLIAVLALTLAQGLIDGFPTILPKHVTRNSEGVLFALVLSAWIQFVRQRLFIGLAALPASLAAGGLCLVLGLVCVNAGLPSSLKTLNEALFALAVLIPYASLKRPLGVWWWAVPILAIVIPVAGAGSDQATRLAETFAFLLVIPIALDFADRAILDPSRRRNVMLMVGWLLVVIFVPVLMHVVRPNNPRGVVEEVERYLSRTTEAYVAVIVMHLYFSFLLPAFSRPKLLARMRAR